MKQIKIILLACLLPHLCLPQGKKVILEGAFTYPVSDTIMMEFYRACFGLRDVNPEIQMQRIHDGKFRFEIKGVSKPGYIRLLTNSNTEKNGINLYRYLVDPSDSVSMIISHDQIFFSGRQCAKYRCRYALDHGFIPDSPTKMISHELIRDSLDKAMSYWKENRYLRDRLYLLSCFEPWLTRLDFEILKCDLIASTIINFHSWFIFQWIDPATMPDSVKRRKYFQEIFDKVINIEPDVSIRAKELSAEYPTLFLIKRLMSMKIRMNKLRIDDAWPLYIKMKEVPGTLGEKLLASYCFFLDLKGGMLNSDSCKKDALASVYDPFYRKVLKDYVGKTFKGATVPEFVFYDLKGKSRNLKEFRGKVVLIDFWFTGCDACIHCARALQKVIGHFKGNEDIVFLTVSVDTDFRIWQNSVHSDTYASPDNEINFYTQGLGSKHPIIRYYNWNGFPEFLLIGRDGKLFSASPPRPDEFNGAEKLTALINEALGELY